MLWCCCSVFCAESDGESSGDEYDPEQEQQQQQQGRQRQQRVLPAVSPILGGVHPRDEEMLSDELRRM
jgi:hypothetical protein